MVIVPLMAKPVTPTKSTLVILEVPSVTVRDTGVKAALERTGVIVYEADGRPAKSGPND